MFKGYLHKSAANKNKTELAQTVLIPFRNALKEHYSYLLYQQQQGLPILKRTKLKQKDFKTKVSARQIQSLYTQVFGIFESQQALLEKKVKILTYCSSLSDYIIICLQLNIICAIICLDMRKTFVISSLTGDPL